MRIDALEAAAAIVAIAKSELRLDTLDTRWSDPHDFHTFGVWEIRVALERAYAAGFKAGNWREEPKKEPKAKR